MSIRAYFHGGPRDGGYLEVSDPRDLPISIDCRGFHGSPEPVCAEDWGDYEYEEESYALIEHPWKYILAVRFFHETHSTRKKIASEPGGMKPTYRIVEEEPD